MSRIDETIALDRRRLLRAAMSGGALLVGGGVIAIPRLFAGSEQVAGKTSAVPATGPDVVLECFADNGRDLGSCHVHKLVLSDAQWRDRLSPAAYNVMRQNGTEMAFSGPHEKLGDGLYRCAACSTALYAGATQFDSGTGWPSFWQPIAPHNVIENRDNTFGMDRTAISCAGCDSHLGHVFDDGPQPTGLRYCMNAVAMRFVPRAKA